MFPGRKASELETLPVTLVNITILSKLSWSDFILHLYIYTDILKIIAVSIHEKAHKFEHLNVNDYIVK